MRLFGAKPFIGTAAAIALCISPTVATAATAPVTPINPLVAVSVFGTQASAQEVCGTAVGAAAAAGAAVAAQGQAGCVLPVSDAPPPVANAGPAIVERSGIGITPIILGLLGLAALAALIASSNDDGDSPISP